MEKRQVLHIIANNLKSLLSERNVSSTELAKRCRISSGSISKIVNGNMSITVPMAVKLAEGLQVSVNDILKGLSAPSSTIPNRKQNTSPAKNLHIGVLSINNKRITCIKNSQGTILGTSELEGGLDLTETSGSLMDLIQEAIYAALPNKNSSLKLREAHINLVTQSYEFEGTRDKFLFFAKRYFREVILLSDWQLFHLTDFGKKPGISLITDKGVSLSYRHNGLLKKLGGWKFPVYDLGGENWLGVETIRHTIEAAEGYIPMSGLAQEVLAKFEGKIEKITETCFKGEKNPDIYCLFCDLLLRAYTKNDPVAKKIFANGFGHIHKNIERVDRILGQPLKLTISGSLAEIYKPFLAKNRLISNSNNLEKVKFLANLTSDYLVEYGISI